MASILINNPPKQIYSNFFSDLEYIQLYGITAYGNYQGEKTVSGKYVLLAYEIVRTAFVAGRQNVLYVPVSIDRSAAPYVSALPEVLQLLQVQPFSVSS